MSNASGDRSVARQRALTSAEAERPGRISYCPFCGHAVAEDMTVEKRFGVQVVLCPPERLRITYSEFSGMLTTVKL